MRLGNRIHELRTSFGLSQGVLAEKLGVSRQAISKWENDSAVPEPEKLLMIAEVFQVTLDQLVEDGTPSTDAASAPAVSGFTMTSVSTDQLAGGLLIGISLVGILWQKAHIYTSMLWIFIPVVLCGLLCLRIRGRAHLWCCWAVYLMLDASIFYQDWTHWWSLFERHRGMFRYQSMDSVCGHICNSCSDDLAFQAESDADFNASAPTGGCRELYMFCHNILYHVVSAGFQGHP